MTPIEYLAIIAIIFMVLTLLFALVQGVQLVYYRFQFGSTAVITAIKQLKPLAPIYNIRDRAPPATEEKTKELAHPDIKNQKVNAGKVI